MPWLVEEVIELEPSLAFSWFESTWSIRDTVAGDAPTSDDASSESIVTEALGDN